jgi:D-alanyl-D-alanine carboxypeptidase/D-alanyl-D-alanine-endopeptidase (penicillin-binding protein 4)
VVADVVGDLGAPRVVDGSGLSLDDRVTCGLLVDVLGRPDTGNVIDDLLAVAGVSGTLKERFRGTPFERVVRAKTGSLTSVASLAGIVEDGDPPLTFAFIVNAAPPAPVPDGVDALQRQVLDVLASWPRTPDVTVLGPEGDDG